MNKRDMKKGDKVKVVYAEKGVPESCYYIGPGIFSKHIKKPHDWGDDEMCSVVVPDLGLCDFPTECVHKA